ncbi:MAG: 30S ribosomal protein S13 [Candidatus Rehaiarchaeum fermentans]|nr:30S ribosomal protein S13 [Candidatus Rehaiarchaeum fermentans]
MQKGSKEQEKEKKEIKEEKIIRLGDVDIPASFSIYKGLLRIHGISYSIANAIIRKLQLENKTFGDLDSNTIEKIKELMSQPSKYLPNWLLNYRTEGEKEHYFGDELKSKDRLHLEELKNSGTWRGFRHQLNYKVRGQRTRSRGANVKGRVGSIVGVTKKSNAPQKGENK